ncbi:alpha/beta hydrolase [Nocardia sp. CA-128927]|uniref:alpha/beta hydrolase n=1 Tax=Nocardia sp. CA-128927 TaxID=3239975 RepID=UPI003D97A7F9
MDHIPPLDIIALRQTLVARGVNPNINPPVAESRQAQEAYGLSAPFPDGMARSSSTLGGVPTEVLYPVSGRTRGALLYFHAGGYSSGSPAGHAALVGNLAQRAGVAAYVVDYRRAPENPYPAAANDAFEAYRGLLALDGVTADRVIVAGDSAGGGLSLIVAQRAAASGLPTPAAAYLMSPWADLTQSGKSYAISADHDPMLSRTALSDLADIYLGDHDPTDPLASPVFGKFSHDLPLLLHVGSDEVLLSDSLAVASRAALGGSAVTLKVWPHMIHCFPWFHHELAAGRQAIDEAAEWITTMLPEQQPSDQEAVELQSA